MKKKIIVSLILAACCVMASIPASAGETATCPPHTSYLKLCGGFAESKSPQTTHYYDADGDGRKNDPCTYMEINFYTRIYCNQCYEEMNGSMNKTHPHGIGDHICGETNYNYCPIT